MVVNQICARELGKFTTCQLKDTHDIGTMNFPHHGRCHRRSKQVLIRNKNQKAINIMSANDDDGRG